LAFSQKPDYCIYHGYINTAEKLFFIDNNVDSSLYYYEKAFNSFEFIFVKDLVNAAQIAYYSNKPYKKYIVQGFDFGLKLSHLSSINLFKPVYNDLINDKYLKDEYTIRREKYIKHIDFGLLSLVYKTYIYDQLNKRKNHIEYDGIKYRDLEFWKKTISAKGFPSAKHIGIDDKTIFAEIGKPDQDIDNLKLKYSNNLKYLSCPKANFFFLPLKVQFWQAPPSFPHL